MSGLIRIDDATRLGPALGDIRTMLGYSRHALAHEIAAATGRDTKSISNQLIEWENAQNSPTVRKLGPLLDALGYQLALVPRENA